MPMPKTKPTNFEEYIAGFPEHVQGILQELRETIKKAAPKATEVISYSMPAFRLNGMLVWFGGHSKHIGFYPRASGIAAFKKELSVYKNAKGSVQFPIDKPLPKALITKIVKFRVNENMGKAGTKIKKTREK